MEKLKEAINSWSYRELKKIEYDLDNGGTEIRKFLKAKIKEVEDKKEKICVVCGENIDPLLMENFILIFGPNDFKKKASFCAFDCLEYFLRNLREMKIKTLKKRGD